MLHESILTVVGKTPLVKIRRISSNLDCNLYAKCEFLNPGGSIKDRIAVRMIEKAEKAGRIKPGDTLIEPTSGNTGIGMALAGAVKGYQIIITMPEKMSKEKQVILESLGAQIIRTPNEAAWDDPESHIGVAKNLVSKLPNAHILDQYGNPENPNSHYYGTGEEIIKDLDGKIDMLVIGAGTGGTVTGLAKRIKEVNPSCIVVAADPIGSILAGEGHVGPYKVEGIGYDFVPDVLDRKLVDVWVKTNDRQSFLLARSLMRDEGLLCGGSSGAAMSAALKEAVRLGPNQNCVVILPDGVRNYLSKFVDNKWMEENHFKDTIKYEGKVHDFIGAKKESKILTIDISTKIGEAVKIMREYGFSQLPVVKNESLVGMLHENDMLENLLTGKDFDADLAVNSFMRRSVQTVLMQTPLTVLQDILMSTDSVVVVSDTGKSEYIITKIDLVEWIMNIRPKGDNKVDHISDTLPLSFH
ncbi:MAG: cystathionine beta-synthase [Zetaproteobacteria bacterium]|nr:cystathionine beta-synthase [Pseudobdellovibrionaceae bacterium]